MVIQKVAVIGLGVMGEGIVQVTAQAGLQVVALDINDALIEKGINGIKSYLTKSVEKGKITTEQKDNILTKIKGTTNYDELKDCDLVIEAVSENLELKKKIFKHLGGICKPETIFATNTSVLSVIHVGSDSGRIHKVVGLHFFNPVPLMKSVEIIKTLVTSEATIATVRDYAQSIGKIPVYSNDTPGFIIDRLLIAWCNNAIRMLEAGVGTVEDIDKAITLSLNHPMGPFQLMDLVGLDIHAATTKNLYEQLGDPQYFTPITTTKMIAAGWLGRKTGRGFYDYKESNK